ncbi:MAG: GAF domain-containing protein [Terriglobales bacterium]
MATQRPALTVPLGELAALLLAEREVAPRAEVIAGEAAALAPGCAINLYMFSEEEEQPWFLKATVGEVSVDEAALQSATLTELARQRQPLLFAGSQLAREYYAHLDVRRTIVSLAYVPILLEEVLIGAIEAISFERALTPEDVQAINQLNDLSALALATAVAYESERNSSLDSITRMTALYDVEKVFTSTLQMDELMPIITAKVRELLNVQGVNLWVVEEEDLLLMNRDGDDPTLEDGAIADDIIRQVGENGESVLIADGSDPRLVKRNGEVQEGAIFSQMAVPVMDGESLVGALECVNRNDGAPFDDDDLFFLGMMAETAGRALHNASLMEAEKKIEVLETLVQVSNEITSTLNLDRVLQTVVNAPQKIIAFERAAVALEERGKFRIGCISGQTEIMHTDPAVRKLREMLEWSAQYEHGIHVYVQGDDVIADREETRAKFQAYFLESGARSWYAVPLADDQGRLGMLSFESSVPDFLSDAQMEFVKVLASQATVAVRNASLYKEVPLIGVLEPLIQRKHQFMAMEKRRRMTTIALAVATVLFLVFVPLPMRVAGESVVAPQVSTYVQSELDGVIKNIHVREGDHVVRGTVLAELQDWDYRSALAAAQAKLGIAQSAMNRALASNDGGEAGIQRVQADYWAAEVTRAKERLERTRLRSPIDGVVVTPHVETLIGTKLSAGDSFAEVANTSHATVDVAVDETDVPLLQAGDSAKVKLESFPTQKFRGQVQIVSPTSSTQADKRVYFARVDLANAESVIRPGMQGITKISVGWHPAGYVIFRGVGMWAWGKLWSWFGW